MKTYRHVICGVGLKVLLISDGNIVTIKFSSDYSVNRAGFNITFVPIDGKFEGLKVIAFVFEPIAKLHKS